MARFRRDAALRAADVIGAGVPDRMRGLVPCSMALRWRTGGLTGHSGLWCAGICRRAGDGSARLCASVGIIATGVVVSATVLFASELATRCTLDPFTGSNALHFAERLRYLCDR